MDMREFNKQNDRLNFLLEGFRADSKNYKDIKIPSDGQEKVRILRSLMNIRMPGKMSEAIIKVQDEYLKECTKKKGIVEVSDIEIIKENISIWQGDITRLKLDAIVNAANSQMLGCFIPMHTCIDNQIHTFAGVQLRDECNRKMNELRKICGNNYEQPTAIPMLTNAYNLPAKKVIHIVGPIVESNLTAKKEDELASCYENTLDMCLENGLRSVAFCCISTGVFHFPNKRAAEIAVSTVEKWISKHPESMDRIVFNVFKEDDREYYEKLLR